MDESKKERHGCINAWLWIAIIANIGMSIFYVMTMFYAYSGETALGLGLCSILGTVNVLSVILLFRWNKIDFYMMIVSSIIAIVVNICVLNMEPVAMIGSLFAIVIWWAILQIKKNGISAWNQLQSGWDGKHCRHLYQLFGVIGIILFVLTMVVFGNCSSKSDYSNDEIATVADDEAMPEDEIEEVVVEEEETVEEKNLRFLRSMIEETDNTFPQKIEEGVVMKKIYLEGDYVIYQAECDEDILDMKLLNQNKSNMKQAIKKNLKSSDPEITMFRKTCIKANKGLGYKYVGDTSGQSVLISFSCKELESM